jgi:hypothetical protein
MPLASHSYHRPLDPRFSALLDRASLAALAPPARLEMASAIAAALGPAFQPHPELVGNAGLPAVRHEPSGLLFVAIPGGQLTMGLSPEEIAEIAALYAPLGRADEARDAVTWSTQPPHLVGVLPFLCAVQPVSDRLAHALVPDLFRGDEEGFVPGERAARVRPSIAAGIRGALGMRFLSEADWEWIAREGGARRWLSAPPARISLELDPAGGKASAPNAFGIDLLHGDLELVGDAWHEGYEGAPGDGAAWDPRAVPDNARGCHSGWQDEMEAIRLHAGVREGKHGDDEAVVRLAIDLP